MCAVAQCVLIPVSDTNMEEDEGVSNITDKGMTDSCGQRLSMDSAGGTQASLSDDSFPAGNRPMKKVIVGLWAVT